jgi:enamine deaminase RidA (YjgF/YER057c/UK114 family)
MSTLSELFLGDDPIPVGTRIGDVIHGLRFGGADPSEALDDMQRVVEAAGACLDNVAQVSFFVKDAALLETINPAWLRVFPNDDDRPTYKFMTADLPAERLVHLEFFAIANQRRRLLHIPNVAHTNPIPMGVRIGSYVFSSRVLPYDAETGQPPEGVERQAQCLFQNVRTLLDVAGAKPVHITQARLFLYDPSTLAIAERFWKELISSAPPPLHVTHYTLAPSLRVMLEFIAVVPPEFHQSMSSSGPCNS